MVDATDEQIAYFEVLIATLRRRQRVLEAQRARFGEGTVPAYIVLELEDLAREVTRNEAELRRLRPGLIDDRKPYLGLHTFQEEDANRFFGRDALVADMIDRASRSSFLVVLGPSGSGKSSAVRAGLLPMLKGGALPGSEHWRYAMLRPGTRPLDVLAAEMAKLQDRDLDQALRLRANLAEHSNALLLAADLVLDRRTEQRLVLLVDQFEELWTLTPSEERAQFINILLTAASAPDTRLLLVLAIRADFLHHAAEHPVLAQVIANHDVIVSPMTDVELRAAIVRPTEAASGSFEAGLIDQLVDQALGTTGALPLLEYSLQELWKQRQPDGLMTWEAYRALGGIGGALAARADALLAQCYTSEQQEDLRHLLLCLVQPGEGAADTRRRVFLDDLVPAGASLGIVQGLLQPLTDARLLTTGRDDLTNKEIIEISHEALIRAWPTFGRWIADTRDDLRFQLQLEAAAREWQNNNENADLLWSGLRLAQAELWIERAQPRLNMRDQNFLDTSRDQTAMRAAAEEASRHEREALLKASAAAERRNASRLRIFLAVGSVLLLWSIALTGYALWQRQMVSNALQQSRLLSGLAITPDVLANMTSLDSRVTFIDTALAPSPNQNTAASLAKSLLIAHQSANLRQALLSQPLASGPNAYLLRVMTDSRMDLSATHNFYVGVNQAQIDSESLLRTLDSLAKSSDMALQQELLQHLELERQILHTDSRIAYLWGLLALRTVDASAPNVQEKLAAIQNFEPRQLITQQEIVASLQQETKALAELNKKLTPLINEAQQGLDAALIINPNDSWNIVVGKAIALRKLGNTDRAIEAFRLYGEMFSVTDPTAAMYSKVAQAFTQQIGSLRLEGAMYVYEVIEGSAAQKAGIQVGDIVIAVDGQTTSNADGFDAAVRGLNHFPFEVRLLRKLANGSFVEQTVSIPGANIGISVMPI